jgi:TonB family protein
MRLQLALMPVPAVPITSSRLRSAGLGTMVWLCLAVGCASMRTGEDVGGAPCTWDGGRLVVAGEPFGVGVRRVSETPGVVLPKELEAPQPRYTPAAMRRAIRGTVQVDIVLLETGRIGDIRVAESLDPDYGLDQQAVCAASRWLFEPARLDGVAIPLLLRLEFTFNIR